MKCKTFESESPEALDIDINHWLSENPLIHILNIIGSGGDKYISRSIFYMVEMEFIKIDK
jgi:hypothetical protein